MLAWIAHCREKPISKQALKIVDKEKEKAIAEKSLEKLNAIERFVNLAIIAQGVLSYLAITKDKCIWEIHRASSWQRRYSSILPSDEVTQRALQSQLLTTFSLHMVRDWIDSSQQPKLQNSQVKVRQRRTLEHFLSD